MHGCTQLLGCTQPNYCAWKYSSALCLFISILLALFAPLNSQQDAQAQSSQYEWSTPVKIDERQEPVSEMTLAADQSGLVHLFWNPLGTSEIFYSFLDEQTWSYPMDVISSPGARAPSAVVDAQGYIHLIWNASLQVHYSQAKVESASMASAWTEPVALAGSLTHAQIVIDPQGTLLIAYPGLDSAGPAILISEDGGVRWSDPISISPTSRSDAAAEYVRAAISNDGTIHVVWTEYQLPNGFPPFGVYYAQSNDGGRRWSNPVQLAGEQYVHANIATYGEQVVHVAWDGMAGTGGRYHRYSSDGGGSWSEPYTVTPAGEGGSEGPPQLAIDSNGTLHLATTFGQRVWYSLFQNRSWSNPTYIPSGDETGIPLVGQSIDPNTTRFIERVVMAVNQGNRLHLVFWDSRPARQALDYWYTTRETSAAATALLPYPTSPPAPTQAVFQSLAAQGKPTPTISSLNLGDIADRPFTSTGLPVMVGVAPILIFVIGLLLYATARARKK
jgi:hypothetical protein